jgi:hypothetical protein
MSISRPESGPMNISVQNSGLQDLTRRIDCLMQESFFCARQKEKIQQNKHTRISER